VCVYGCLSAQDYIEKRLKIILFGVGCEFKKRWWGKSLGVAGVFLWMFVGLMAIGQST